MKAVAFTRYLPVSEPESFVDVDCPYLFPVGATCWLLCMLLP